MAPQTVPTATLWWLELTAIPAKWQLPWARRKSPRGQRSSLLWKFITTITSCPQGEHIKNGYESDFLFSPLACWIRRQLSTLQPFQCEEETFSCVTYKVVVVSSAASFFFFFFFNVIFERAQVGERQRETESEAGSRLWAVSTEPNVGLEPTNCEILTWTDVRHSADWATKRPPSVASLIQCGAVFCHFLWWLPWLGQAGLKNLFQACSWSVSSPENSRSVR